MDTFALAIGLTLRGVHLAASALAGGAPVVVALARLSPGLRSCGDAALRRVLGWSVFALLVGLLSGALSGLLVWLVPDPGYLDAAARFPSGAYAMLAGEWLFTAVLYAACWVGWRWAPRRVGLHSLIVLIAATNLLYHFPTFMIVLGRLSSEPANSVTTVIDRQVFLGLLLRPEPLARTAHFWALSLLAGGLAVMAASGAGRQQQALRRAGVVFSLVGVLATLLSGGGVLLALPPAEGQAMLGGSAPATIGFALALAGAIAMMHALVATLIDDARSPPAAWRLAALFVVAIAAMLVAAASA